MELTPKQIYQSWMKRVPYKKRFNIDEVDGFTSHINNTAFIWFEGTEGVEDVISDVQFWKKRIPYKGTNPSIRVHSGFISQYHKIREYIHAEVKDYPYAIVMGHSLGSALACLCALDLQYNFGTDCAVIALGSPRIGNRKFVESYESRIKHTYRYIYRSDIVAKLPPWFFFYKHIGQGIQMGKKRFPIPFLRIINAVKDHYPKCYKDGMREFYGFDNDTLGDLECI